MSKTVSETMGDIMTRIAAPRAGQSRVMLNHCFSQRQGWDQAEELTEEGIKTGKPKLLARPMPNGGNGIGIELERQSGKWGKRGEERADNGRRRTHQKKQK